MRNPSFFPVQVYYEDTDATGRVYHANYLKFMERARTHFLESIGFRFLVLESTFGIQFLVKALDISYEKPVRLQEKIVIVTELIQLRKASLIFSQKGYSDPEKVETLVFRGKVRIVCTDRKGKPCALPAAIIRGITGENGMVFHSTL